MNLKEMRNAAATIMRAAIAAVMPDELIRNLVSLDGARLQISHLQLDLNQHRKIIVVGTGKATASMARALQDILNDRISEGVIVVPKELKQPLARIQTFEAGHPIPDEEGVAGARAMLSLVKQNAQADALFLCLISGGGSALLPYPADGISLADKQLTTKFLLDCGASISEFNTVRKHLSKIKGGQLARAAWPARVVSLILSDVVGDKLDIIASGLTAPDPSTFADAVSILYKYQIWQSAPQSVTRHLENGMSGRIQETPKPSEPSFTLVDNILIGNNTKALQAAAECAHSLGFRPLILSSRITGEAREVGALFASIVKEVELSQNPVAPPACVLAGGETTVTIRGDGKGGRSQEAALAAAIALADSRNIVIAAVGTDGADGPTDAAGAVVDSLSTQRALAAGVNPIDYLNRNDSYRLHEATGDLVITGRTGTNVMDLLIGLIS